jgi:hypothetical protein
MTSLVRIFEGIIQKGEGASNTIYYYLNNVNTLLCMATSLHSTLIITLHINNKIFSLFLTINF